MFARSIASNLAATITWARGSSDDRFQTARDRYALSGDISIAYQAMGVVTDLVAGAGLKFAERGSFELKRLPGRWDLFAASG
jgi:hypothetical protein